MGTPKTTEPTTEVLCFRLLLLLAQQLRYLMDQRLASDGLTTQQAMLLGVVERHPRPPCLAEVARAMATSYQNTKQLAVVLERKGFLTLAPDPSDRRVRRLRATGRSRRYWRRRDESDFARIGALFAGLAARERESLLRGLHKLETGVDRAYRAARG